MLFTGSGETPFSYLTLMLCRDVYHCPPSVLLEQDWGIVSEHLILLNAEAKVKEHRAKAERQKARARRSGARR